MPQHIDYDEEAKYRTWWLNNTGGSAHDGLTVRDYFAAKAMQALLSAVQGAAVSVTEAYKIADLMMKERAK